MSTPALTYIPLAARLRTARQTENLSQAELAARLGVSARTLQGWEAETGPTPQPRHRRAVLAFIEAAEGVVTGDLYER